MGLQATVWHNVRKANSDDEDCFLAKNTVDYWDYKVKNLEKGALYTGDLGIELIGYSYSTHATFRQSLLDIIGRSDLVNRDSRNRIYWAKLTKDLPFYELIYFADHQGILDWEINQILHKNFLDWKDTALAFFNKRNNVHFTHHYLDWLETFHQASQIGSVVEFH